MNIKPKILIVDDEPRICKSIKALLHTQGYDVQICHNGHEAIAYLKKNSFDLILQDIFMEGMDGFMVLDAMRKKNIEIPVIMMTGNASTRSAVKAMKIGANDYIKKPFEPDELFSLIKSTLHQRTLEIENKNVVKKLNASEKKFRNLVESSNDWIYEINAKGFYTYASPQVKDILGYTPEEIIGKTLFDILLPEEIERVANTFNSLMKNPCEIQNFEKTCIHKDGFEVILESNGTPFFDETGVLTGFRGVKRDITQRKKADDEKKQLRSQLRQSQKMESIGNLAGGIAHDFNNLLFPIIGMSELLLEDLPEDSLEYENVKEILQAGKRAGDLVNQILAFSRQSEHKMLPVRVQSVLKEVLKLSRSTIPANIKIQQNIQQNCGLVMADPTQIHQIGMNLITNAFHAIESKNGTIDIELKEITLKDNELSVSEMQPGQYIKLSVSDNGTGMSENTIQKIFEPYFTTKEQGKGTGLGLAVIYGIVKEHKGEIKVCSELGKGATFNIYLPLMEKLSEVTVVDNVARAETGTERILLVDDEVSVAKLEGQMLSRLGYQVTLKTDSNDLLNTFKINPNSYDLVISDMTMPNMTGDQLAKELLSIKSDIPIIICTGFSEKINKDQAKTIGVNGFLLKPVVKLEMAQMVRKVLDEAKNAYSNLIS